ncbi:MAG: type II toxin-antitoxin system RelE/ParE family toxin, partial [Candidatus Edwardsbacteria bacterium]|nr:type II toxin-antitoxin system RelE/ParE family toxin [Candidatus Edwardsbacteria bacterium]
MNVNRLGNSAIHYDVQFKPQAVKDLRGISPHLHHRILARIEEMSAGLKGDVKRLTGLAHEYRLRVGDYRILFELAGRTI